MAALTVRTLEGVLRYTVGGKPGTPLELRELVNQAGEFLVSMHPWRWLEGRELRLRPRAAITLEGATWTELTRTLTLASAFDDYSFLSADTLDLAEGTGATPGTYEVESRTSGNAIVLATSIGAAADGQTDIGGRMPNTQIALAPGFDLQAITGYALAPGMIGAVELTSPQSVLDLRQWPSGIPTVGYWGLVNYVRSLAGGQPAMRLDHWPEASESTEQIVLFYRGGWIEPAEDTTELQIPGWLNLLFIELCKAVVSGYEDPEEGSVDERLTRLKQGSLFAQAIQRDTMLQPDVGPMVGGWLDVAETDSRFSNYTHGPVS